MIKEKLLSLGIIDHNDYFEKYVQLIINNVQTEKQTYKTQRHHIIPRCYYKHKKLDVDNSSENLVNLLYRDHILAHYYLCLCVKDENIRHDCIMAFTYLTDRIDSLKITSAYNLKIDIEYSREEIVQQLPHFQELYEEARKAHGEKMKGKASWNKGIKSSIKRVAINNGTSTKYVPEAKLSEFLDNGWQLGRHNQQQLSESLRRAMNGRAPHNKGKSLTDEQKEHLRQINLGKKQSDETIEKRRAKLIGRVVSEETKERLREANIGQKRSDETRKHMSEAKKGRIPHNKGKTMSEEQKNKISHDKKGRLWVTNGEKDKMIKQDEYTYYESIGFRKGRSCDNGNERSLESEN